MLWSVAANWPGGAVPKADEDVTIDNGMNMVFDLEGETPIYRLVRVNGQLTFKNDLKNTTFNAKHIFIRAGELHIGNKTHPFLGNCMIKLHGEKDAKHIVYDNAIEAGNKLIANLNVMRIYGKQRSHHFSRLHREAKKGDDIIHIQKGMDIVAGDRLALLPTSFDNMASDDVFVKSYDTLTGETHLMSKLDWYHWGALESRASEYNGADMRGEVLLLTRNIRIAGEDIESWGGQIVTSDTVEINSLGEMAVRSGSTVMENVEVYNCSQIDTQKAAIRWEGATQKYSEVTNCTFHNGYSWGVYIKSSTNILFRDNIVFNFRPVGINLSNTKNVTIDHNVIGHIQQRTTLETDTPLEDKEACLVTCTYFGKE